MRLHSVCNQEEKKLSTEQVVEEEVVPALGQRPALSVQDARTITRLIIRVREGDETDSAKAEEDLFDLVMADLRRRAESALRRYFGMNRALEADDLISESWETLHKALASYPLKNRSHFFAYAYNKFTWLLLDSCNKAKESSPFQLPDDHPDEEIPDPLQKSERLKQIWCACTTLSGSEAEVFGMRHFGIDYLDNDVRGTGAEEFISGLLPRDEPVFRRIAAARRETLGKTWCTYQSALKKIKNELGTDPRVEKA